MINPLSLFPSSNSTRIFLTAKIISHVQINVNKLLLFYLDILFHLYYIKKQSSSNIKIYIVILKQIFYEACQDASSVCLTFFLLFH